MRHIKFRARPLALAIKVPGFPSFTGYKHAEFMKGAHLMSMGQFK